MLKHDEYAIDRDTKGIIGEEKLSNFQAHFRYLIMHVSRAGDYTGDGHHCSADLPK